MMPRLTLFTTDAHDCILGEPGDSAFLTTLSITSRWQSTDSTVIPQIPHKKLIMQSKIGDVTISTVSTTTYTVTVAAKAGGR